MDSYVLITGATGGLGSAFAMECARRGYAQYLTDQRPEVEDLSEFLTERYGVEARYRICDLTSIPARQQLSDALKDEGSRFWGLINVAGTESEGPFLEQTGEQIQHILQLNVAASIDMAHMALNLRDPQRRFMLINVSSMAAFFPMPNKATYAASKRFLLDFSRALGEEIRDFGTVTALCPAGLPTTPRAMRAIFAQGFWGKVTTADTRAVIHRTIDLALKGRAVYVPGGINRFLVWLSRLLPDSVVARYVGRRWHAAQLDTTVWPPPGWETRRAQAARAERSALD
jgi:short-subunit dehydrogenase